MNKKTGYERVENGEKFYHVDIDGNTIEDCESGLNVDKAVYNTANYYSSSLVAEENARADELMRKLRRFAAMKNECELDWKDKHQSKYYIRYSYAYQELYIEAHYSLKHIGQIYFSSSEIAKQAMNEYENELLWYFTEYTDHVIEVETEKCEYCGNTEKLQAMKVLGFKCCYECGKELEG